MQIGHTVGRQVHLKFETNLILGLKEISCFFSCHAIIVLLSFPLSLFDFLDSSCSVRIETVKASRGLFVARCQKVASSPNARGHGDGDLPEMLVLLFNRKMVEDLKLKSGTTLTVHPPW